MKPEAAALGDGDEALQAEILKVQNHKTIVSKRNEIIPPTVPTACSTEYECDNTVKKEKVLKKLIKNILISTSIIG